MKFKIVERKKKLNEQDKASDLEVSMPPLSYIKLTTKYDDFQAILTFIQNKSFEEAKDISSFDKRKAFVEETLGRAKTQLSVQLILGALNFLNPSDVKKWGAFDEDKSGTAGLTIEVREGMAKVKDHEGRNRTLYRCMKGEKRVNVSLYFMNEQIKTIQEMPRTLVSQFDDTSKVFREEISTPISSDSSKFRTIEGFVNFLGAFPTQAVIDSYKDKSITVDGDEVVLLKAVAVNKGPDGKYYTGMYKPGLYKKEVLSVNNTRDVNYWVEVDKYKLPLEKGPVVIR